jgi:hypothetical protein
MPYESGSLLSIGAGATLEQVLVLSDGRVATKLFGGKPVAQRDILNLSDWLMLAEGQAVRVTLPLNKGSMTALPASPAPEPAENVAAPVAAPVAEPVAAPVPTVYAIGTMLRWIKDDQNKRVALIMNDSVLQVKETIAGNITRNQLRMVKRSSFKDFAEWKASLPEGGAITAEATTPWAPTIEEKAKAPIVAATDAGYIAELAKRYLIRSDIHQNTPPTSRLEYSRRALKEELERLPKSLNIDDNNLGRIIMSAKNIIYYAEWMSRQIIDIKKMTPQEASAITYNFNNYYRQKLFAYKNGLKYEICAKGDVLAMAPSAEGSKYRGNALTGKSFAEIGIEMKSDGKPRLEVSYYRRRIEL